MTLSLAPQTTAARLRLALGVLLMPVLAAATVLLWVIGTPTPPPMISTSPDGQARVEQMAADLVDRGVIEDGTSYVVRDLGWGAGGSIAGATDWSVPGVVWIDDEVATWWIDQRLTYVLVHEHMHARQASLYDAQGDGVWAAVQRLRTERHLEDIYGGNGVERQADCATQHVLGYGDRSASAHACTGEVLEEALLLTQ